MISYFCTLDSPKIVKYGMRGCTEGWIEKKKGFGLKMDSTSGRTREGVSTSEKKSQPWSPLIFNYSIVVPTSGRNFNTYKLSGANSNVEIFGLFRSIGCILE